ncbi:MAG: hypothetical protein GOU97_03630 [Nanoarchaeota archaeon]|nr:hypothetical protein [Nanoarchaeota archaeon]
MTFHWRKRIKDARRLRKKLGENKRNPRGRPKQKIRIWEKDVKKEEVKKTVKKKPVKKTQGEEKKVK